MRISRNTISGQVRHHLIHAAVAMAIAASAAQAQDAPQDSGQLDEITVTATRRAESLQDVPVAVSVLSGDQLVQANLNSLEAISSRIPTLNFRANASNKDTSLFIRGVGTISTSPGVEPSVATVVDGVVFGRAGMGTLDLMDIDRMEVLRGPQGTLFGKNASSGVVNIVSKKIADETEAMVDLGWFEGDEKRIRAGVSGGLSDSVKGSLNLLYGEFPGVIRNVALGDDVGGYDRKGIRGKLEFTPSDALGITLIADWAEADDTGSRGPFTRANAAITAAISPIVPMLDNDKVFTNVKERVEDTNYGVSAQVDWQLGESTLTSITAYRKWENTQFQDLDGTNIVYNQITQNADKGIVDNEQVSQELRLASAKGGFLEYVGGLFYFKTTTDEEYRRDVTRCNGTLPTLANGLTPCAAPRPDNGVANYGTDLESWAVFGEATLNFSDRFRGILGARYTNDDLSYYHGRVSTGGAVDIPGVRANRARVAGSNTETGTSGRVGLQFDLSDDVMAYATYSRGYKGPAYNAFFNMQAFDEIPIAPEESDSYEIGLKSTLLDNRLRLNLAAFDIKFDGYQANIADLVGGVVVTRLINAGEVSSKGFEADFEARISSAFTLSGALAYTDATIEQFRCPPGNAGCLTLNGGQLPFAPEWKAVIGGNYRVPVGALQLEVGADWTYQDDTQMQLAVATDTIQPAYDIINASIALSDPDGKWRVALLGRNLADESYATNILTGPNTQRGVPRDDRRYFGVNLRWNF
jgi:iron complex outermembrane receptor protein